MIIQQLSSLDSLAQRRYIECVKSGIQFYYKSAPIKSVFAYLYSKAMIEKSIASKIDAKEYVAIVEVYDFKSLNVENTYVIPISVRQFAKWTDVIDEYLPQL